MLCNKSKNTGVTLNNSLRNTIIPSQRLVTTSASLRTQTGLHCLILQVLNTKSLLLQCSPHFCRKNLEHGLVTLTESFSPLESELHNLPCCSPKQKSTPIDTQYNSMTSVALRNII